MSENERGDLWLSNGGKTNPNRPLVREIWRFLARCFLKRKKLILGAHRVVNGLIVTLFRITYVYNNLESFIVTESLSYIVNKRKNTVCFRILCYSFVKFIRVSAERHTQVTHPSNSNSHIPSTPLKIITPPSPY